MKNLKRIVNMVLIGIILLNTNLCYATSGKSMVIDNSGSFKYICIGVGIILILLILLISYKADKLQERRQEECCKPF